MFNYSRASTHLLFANTIVCIRIILQVIAMLGDREQGTARGIEWNAPLYGIQQKQLRPGLLQQDDLVAKRKPCKAGQVLGPLDGHEEQPRARLVHRFMLMRIEIGRHELGHYEAGVGSAARIGLLIIGHIYRVVCGNQSDQRDFNEKLILEMNNNAKCSNQAVVFCSEDSTFIDLSYT